LSKPLNARERQRLELLLVELKWRYYRDNPAAFFKECIQIPAGETLGHGEGKTNFELFDYQDETLEAIRNNRYVIVLKARQLGLTTLMMAYAMWMLLFKPGSNIAIVSRSQSAADKALELIDFMRSFLPRWMEIRLPKLDAHAAKHHSYVFPNGLVSRITSYAATRTVAAGQTLHLVLWDEAALAEYQEDAFRTLMPTTDAGGSMVIFSTARGSYNMFARLYRGAELGENEFKPVFHPWHVSRLMNKLAEQGDVDFTHYDSKKRALETEPWRFFAEYPASVDEAFRQSGRSRFPDLPEVSDFPEFELRGKLKADQFGNINFIEDPTGPLWMREEALMGAPEGCKPVVAIDPASGTGGDYTVMSAGWLDEDGIPQRMAFWRSNSIEPSEYTEDAILLGHYFSQDNGRPALMVVEKAGGYGDTVIHVLRSFNYSNIYVHRYTGHRKYKSETTFGFPMTNSNRPLVIDTLAKWLDFAGGNVMGGLDTQLRRELSAFVIRHDGKLAADVGMNDDLVMATAVMVYVCEQNPFKATDGPIVEVEPHQQVISVNHIWAEAERIWRANDRLALQIGRRRRKELSWR
jgi:hypothetical protein